MECFRGHGKDGQKDNETSHEDANHRGTASTKQIGDESDDDATGHHTNGIAGSDQVGSDRIKVLSKEVGEPKEEDIVGQLEKAKGDGVLGNHRNADGSSVTNGLGALVLDGFAILEVGAGSLELCHADADLVGDNANVGGIGNEAHGKESPTKIGKGGDEKGPPVRKANAKDPGGTKCGGNITTVLVAGPKSKDETTVLHALFVTEPVAHDGSACLIFRWPISAEQKWVLDLSRCK